MSKSPICSYTEWDPLEEVVVGILKGAAVIPWEPAYAAAVSGDDYEDTKGFHEDAGGQAVPQEAMASAQAELNEFVRILEGEGVRVRRPDPLDFSKPYGSPHWTSAGGNCLSNPRDVLLVIGEEVIEATMSFRSRYFEVFGYRALLKEYFREGAKWTAAPKPLMSDELYQPFERGHGYVTSEHEPVFDAADFARMGKDIFAHRSNMTNLSGIEWVRRHIGPQYRVHVIEFQDLRSDHIDSTLVPLAPGKLLVNPDRPIKGGLPDMFKKAGWDILVAPPTVLPKETPGFDNFKWLHLNTLMLDERRIMVEKSQKPMIQALKDWGFQPIPCAFASNYPFGGSFHCATADIRRRGELKSYF
jgi:glycine amidinotransferase